MSALCQSLGRPGGVQQRQQQNASRIASARRSSAAAPRRLQASTVQEAAVDAPARGKLLADKKSFAEQHWVRGYEVEPDRRTSVVTISNLLQECATNHAVSLWGLNEELGFAAAPIMVEKGLILVMTRQQIQMKSYPKWGQIAEVETWYQQEGRLAARRDWVVRDGETKEVLGGATSTWVMVNMNTRKLSKIPDEMRDEFLPFAPEPPRFGLGDTAAKLKLPELELPAQFEAPEQTTRRGDMDMNGHINNTVLLGVVLEAVPPQLYDDRQLYQIEMDFKAECLAGDVLTSLASETEIPEEMEVPEGAQALLHVVSKQDGDSTKEVYRARSVWVPKQ